MDPSGSLRKLLIEIVLPLTNLRKRVPDLPVSPRARESASHCLKKSCLSDDRRQHHRGEAKQRPPYMGNGKVTNPEPGWAGPGDGSIHGLEGLAWAILRI